MMKKSMKWTLGALAALTIGCGSLGAALITKPVVASAEVTANTGTLIQYINVGAAAAAATSEYYHEPTVAIESAASDVTFAGEEGTDKDGLGVFATYRKNATVSVSNLEANDYQVAALVDVGGAITVGGGEAISAEGTRVVSTTATVAAGGSIQITSTGNLYAVMIAAKDSRIYMHSEWTEGQVVVYGKLIEDELTRGCPAYYSDGSVEDAVEYTSIPVGIGDGSTGINANFNAVTATGTFKATDTAVSRYLIAMPEKLVYFINAGSVTNHSGPFGDDSDIYYNYNKTVFDYYKSVGSTLKNDGIPDQESKGNSSVGHYENGWNACDKTAPFPYNSGRVTRKSDFHTTNLGFRLPDVEAGEYTLYIGTMSYWHGRTLGVKINNQSVGNITVPPARVVHTFNVTLTSTGTIDLKLEGEDTNEALASFVALQKAEDAPEAVPADLTSEANTVDLKATELKVNGAQVGARVQIYSGNRPYKLIYEEIVTEGNFDEEDGGYTVNFGEEIKVLTDASKIFVIQLTSGGYGKAYEMSITDIQKFKVTYTMNGKSEQPEPEYTTGTVILNIHAEATSGIDYYKIRKNYNQYEDPVDMGTEGKMDITYVVEENGSYEIVIYSMLGVNFIQRIPIDCIDRSVPTISLTPVGGIGWTGSEFKVKVDVNTVAPIKSYKVVRKGVVNETQTAESSFVLTLTEAGEYLVSVTNATGQVATGVVVVGSKPVYTTVQKSPGGSDLGITFDCIEGYDMSSLAVYRIVGNSASKLSILGTDQVEIYDSGTYVAVVKTNTGATEMFSFEIEDDDFKKVSASTGTSSKPGTSSHSGTNNNASYTGTIVTACLFAVAAGAFVAVLLLKGKRAEAEAEAAPSHNVRTEAEPEEEKEPEVVAEKVESTDQEVSSTDSDADLNEDQDDEE